MKKGNIAIIICPSETAYGSRGAGKLVLPNTGLKFVVEVLEVDI